MRFHLWRRSHRESQHQASRATPDPGDSIDLDTWLRIAADCEPSPPIEDGPFPTPDLCSLRDKLLAVLEDEEASLVPPAAGDMTQQEWDALPDAEREGYRREQLRRIDPRLVPRTTLNSRRTSRATRVYR